MADMGCINLNPDGGTVHHDGHVTHGDFQVDPAHVLDVTQRRVFRIGDSTDVPWVLDFRMSFADPATIVYDNGGAQSVLSQLMFAWLVAATATVEQVQG
jgi:hypothetical protein